VFCQAGAALHGALRWRLEVSMSLHTWLLFVSLAGAVIAAPGPSALLCVTHAARHGVRPALATIVGGMTASMTLMGLSALGLGAVIAASDTLFHIIKWAGAAYLLYLGIATWRSQGSGAADDAAVQTAANASPGAQDHQQADRSMWRTWRPLYRKGLIVGIGNPKDLLFFSALFPQFMDASLPIAGQLGVLALTWLVLDGVIMLGYVLCGATLLARLQQGSAGRWFQRVTGGAFIAAGGVLAASHR
jgi:threonine/homoserine/homoserine lactone efflux protein